ncbi:MAG: disulfide bond formation protein B [Sulfurimicrobium sp.]|jgi:disulfide bond formation protein DsbB|nr:disulfide bond formation protein B [Sulfurimicrobium sp.]MDO9190617.1 disulfide bond formation protein B [Sulfurimicrobium sp.]MDP1704785.1 disulfide bond formation protein B [Sulfurimicrobium sp.]MDP2199214.1 disulfide bond formation protein B [Sulfurimicrobium sp.]MDP3687688.1 disulfide bond formation protein B [Sulfurimicrobium sp.]
MIISFRTLFLAVLVCCLGVLGFGLYLQHIVHLEPCPLCILQRMAFLAIGMTAMLAFLHNPGVVGRMAYGLLMVLFSLAGAGVAGRNLWLQSLPPDQVPECGPGLEYMLEAFPLYKALPMLLKGSGECAKVEWTMFGLSIPAWALGWFGVFFLAGIAALVLRERVKDR